MTELNPVTVKELRVSSWRWQSYAGRGVYVALVGLIVLQFWVQMSMRQGYLSPSEYAHLGQRLFIQFLWVNMALVSFAAIMLTADMFTREVRAGSLALLIASPLTPGRIAFGKFAAAMAHSTCLILCGLPVAATCLYLGGVGYMEVAWCFALTLSMAAVGSGIALWCSARQPTAERAVLHASLWLIGYAVAPLAVGCVGAWPIIFVAPFIHPLYAAFTAGTRDFQHGIWLWAWVAAMPSAFAIAWLFVHAAAKHLQIRVAMADPTPPLNREALTAKRGVLDWFRVQTYGRTRDAHVWDDRPLLWKELATRAAGRLSRGSKQVAVIYFTLLVTAAYLVSSGSLHMYRFIEFLFLLFAVMIGATLFVREKDGRKLELLLVTPITPWEIVRTKLMAGLFAPEGVIVAVMWLVCALLWGVKLGPIECAVHMVASALFLSFAYVLAAAFSLRARTLYAAGLSSAGILLVLILVLPFAASTVAEGTAWAAVVKGALAMVHPTHTTRAVSDGVWPLSAAYASFYVAGIIFLLIAMVRHLDRYPERQ